MAAATVQARHSAATRAAAARARPVSALAREALPRQRFAGDNANRTRRDASQPNALNTAMPARPGDVRTLRTLEYVLGADPAVVRGYAAAIDDAVASGPLTLADRDRLLKRGQRLGLRRFDANLVLAAVEQRHRGPRRVTPRPMVGHIAASPAPRIPSPRRFVWPTAAVAIGVQMVIVAGAWWLVA